MWELISLLGERRGEERETACELRNREGAVKILHLSILGGINLSTQKGMVCACEGRRESINANASQWTGHSIERSSAPERLEIRSGNNFWLPCFMLMWQLEVVYFC